MIGSYFEVLGVAQSATDQDVEEAYQRCILSVGHPDRLNEPIKKAYAVLRAQGTREFYLKLLQSCGKGSVHVPPENQDVFKRFCSSANINFVEDPTAYDHFAVWGQDQAAPRYAESPRGWTSKYTPGFLATLWNLTKATFSFSIFRGKSEWQTAGLLAGYVVGLGAIVLLTVQVIAWVGAAQATRFEGRLRNTEADVSRDLSDVEHGEQQFKDEFQSVVGVALDAPDRPQEISELILQERTVAEAWNILHNSEFSPSDLQSLHTSLSSVNERISAGTFLVQDENRLHDERAELMNWLSSLKEQERELDHIRILLAAKQLEKPS